MAMSYASIEMKIIQWSEARKIIPNSTPEVQLLKAMSEMGELAEIKKLVDYTPEGSDWEQWLAECAKRDKYRNEREWQCLMQI